MTTFNPNGVGRLGTIQTFTVGANASGFYTISAEGGQGGSGGNGGILGGLGALVSTTVFLSAGTTVSIAVGAQGGNGNIAPDYGGGGGGGSFVYIDANLLAAAGGGGGNGFLNSQGSNATIITAGRDASFPSGGAGGTNGFGGDGGNFGAAGGGGGGWMSPGGDGFGGPDNGGGGKSRALIAAFVGGLGDIPEISGGFGGGGGGGLNGGGGGGGYSGGGGGGVNGNGGGGGGSFLLSLPQGSNQVLTDGVGAGNGQVTINSTPNFLMRAEVVTSGVSKIYQVGTSNTVPVTSTTPWWGNAALAGDFANATRGYFPAATTPADSAFMYSYDTNVGAVWSNSFGGAVFQNATPGAATVYGFVQQIPTTVTTSATVNTVPVTTIQFGETVRLGATITDGINTNYLGTTNFFSNGVLLGTGTITGNGSFVALNTDDLTVGVNNITAVYSGDAASAGSTSAVYTINVTALPNTVPSSVTINGFTFTNAVLSGTAVFPSVAGDYAAIRLSSGSGYYGGVSTLMSAANLVELSRPSLQSTGLLPNGEQLLPQAALNLAVLNQFIEPSASPLHYLFASGLSSGSQVSLNNSAQLTPYLTQVAVVNSLQGSNAALDIASFAGVVITGKGVSVTGLTTDNHMIGAGNASYTFGAGTQTMALAGGSAVIDGSSGINTVIVQDTSYFKLAVSTTINGSNSTTQIWTNQGVSTLINVDYLQFNDRTIAINVGVGQSGGEAYRLYQAAFDRAPDTAGLSYWITQLDQGASLTAVANAFMNSPEFKAIYGNNVSNTAFINELYANVLNRAPDTAGNAFWLDQLNSGNSREQVLASFSESVENVGNLARLVANGIEVQLMAA